MHKNGSAFLDTFFLLERGLVHIVPGRMHKAGKRSPAPFTNLLSTVFFELTEGILWLYDGDTTRDRRFVSPGKEEV